MIEYLENIDRNLLLTINSYHNVVFDVIMFYISQIWVFIPLFVFWFVLVLKKYQLKKTLILVGFLGLLVALTDQSSNQIKHAVKRYRPTHNIEIKSQIHVVNDYHGGKYGFFSGHAANTFGVATLLFLLFSQHSKLIRSSFYMWASITAYSRLYLGVHYPSDILVGVLAGIFWGYIIYNLVQLTFKKYFHETISI